MSEEVFSAAVQAANHLWDVRHVPAGVGLKPGTVDQPAIYVYACNEEEAAGFPSKYDGYEVHIQIVGNALKLKPEELSGS